jgi:hypothetical protein
VTLEEKKAVLEAAGYEFRPQVGEWPWAVFYPRALTCLCVSLGDAVDKGWSHYTYGEEQT